MSRPTVADFTGGYMLTWEDEDLVIKVTRCRVHSDGRVTGELLISTAKDSQPVYPQTSFNFTADRTRVSLVKTLTEQDSTHPWHDMFSQLCLIVVDRARQGEPVRELWTSEDIAPPEFLLKPILYKELPTIIFGEKAVCKSTLALAIYACLLLPWHDNPLGWEVPQHPVKTLLADYEVDYKVAQSNAKRLQEGMGLGHFPLYYRRCSLPLADDIEQLQNHMASIGAEVIIVDSLGPAVGGDLKDAGQALRFTTALRQLKCAALVIGQTSKDKEGKNKSVFGCYSQDTEVLTDSGWKPHKDITLNDKVVCFDKEANCLRLDYPLKQWEYDYDGDMIHIKHKASEALVTPNHKVLTTNHGEVTAEMLYHYILPAYKLPYNTPLKPRGKHHGRRQVRLQLRDGAKWLRLEPFLKFIGYWIAEGHIEGDRSGVGLTQTIGKTLDNMKEALEQLGFPYKEFNCRRSNPKWKECHVLKVRYDAGEKSNFNQYRRDKNRKFGRNTVKKHLLAGWLEEHCGKGVALKRIPTFVWDLPRRQQRILFDALIEGDGHLYEAGHTIYTTVSKQLADDVQRLAMLIGLGSQLTHRKRDVGLVQYEVLTSKPSRKTISINPRENIERVNYRGKVYCLTVPTGYYVTRYNGRVAILGNSTMFEYYARNIFELRKVQEDDEDNLDVALYNTYHNLGKRYKPQGFHLSFNGTGTHIEKGEITARELVARIGTEIQTQDFLKHGSATTEEISQEIELGKQRTLQILRKLQNQGKVLQIETGTWGLASKEFTD